MRRTIKTRRACALFTVLIAVAGLGSAPAFADPQPGNACTTANAYSTSGGPENSGKVFTMTCQGGVWVRITESDTAGNLGVKQAAPKAPLHVGGEAILGTSTGLACDAAREGGLRYNTTSDCVELCNGTSWACISVAACGDATSNSFDFTDLVNQSTSTLVTSNILQISGLGCVVNLAVSGEGSPQYRTCSDATCTTVLIDWTATTGTIANNSYLQLRMTTSAAGGDTYSATVSVGTGADVWNATPTGDCSGSPAPGTVCPDGTVYAGLSPDGNVNMYVTRCDAGQTWDGSACTGSRFNLPWNSGMSTGQVWTGYNSQLTGEVNTTGIAAIDADSNNSGFQDHASAVYCNNLSQDGQTDWYLPSRQELNVIYGNRTVIANFITTGTYYWSSSEDSGFAWRQKFSDGSASGWYKESSNSVRCARR